MGQQCMRQMPLCNWEPPENGNLEAALEGFRTNSAVIFLKPSAVNSATISLVEGRLEQAGIKVTQRGRLEAAEIRQQGLFDLHYRNVAAKALTQAPKDLSPSKVGLEEFKRVFRTAWRTALKQGIVLNTAQAAERLHLSAEEVCTRFLALKPGKDVAKLGGGFYAGRIEGIFVINGYYPALRDQYMVDGACIHYFALEWPTDSELSFAKFLHEIRGNPDPAKASEKSLRGVLFKKWKELGLQQQPTMADNGLHASGSPFEAMLDRHTWLGVRIEDDVFMKALNASAGIPLSVLKVWLTDPVVTHDWTRCQLFDLLKGLNTSDCLQLANTIHCENDGTFEKGGSIVESMPSVN
mmetsp:Transcript_52081/g.124004  ORF Transcript_52081/g.124004 Transcript_52081/m.124004 type:complete len:352 (-) Transcript_52081:58-1113(-)